ncbi:pyruvate decarboxylase [Delitschia confertaspora ATCC 74209]|uniref:Pyruvate decarboxylase n=1 Tax=Delitschia confertaspora ATCC 74209 TaxID=1513339 RepID=A0A9P4MN64_9PLEO|nr:pyruvate decarboxylase [Delitschia confertaspora ATCC 74209]
MPETIPLGRYVWERIHQVGIDTIFGVPGDFNLQFLDYIFEVEGLKWVGNQNELNAAYAADGYARIKGVPGAFVTTHGVGELSAINGIAGSMSERVKVIHVVGQTTRAMQEKHMMIHHSIGHVPDHQVYNNASRGLRIDAAELWDVKTAPAEVDRVIRECFMQSGPVYIFLPLDLSAEHVDASLLSTPIDLSPKIDEAAQEKAVSAIKEALEAAKNPCVLIDALVQRFGAGEEARELVKSLKVPYCSSNMGKGIADETDEMCLGVYNGEISAPGVVSAWEASDLTVLLGYLPADTNSGGFSRSIDQQKTIYVNQFEVVVKGTSYGNTHLKPLLAALVKSLPSTPLHNISPPRLPAQPQPNDLDAKHVTHSWLWPQIEKFLQPGDVVIGETGTSVFGLCDIKFPEKTQFHAQIYYGSIGYATAATLGAEIARRELFGDSTRTVLITGDGSMALTIQEIGTMIKAGIKPVIFIINNAGYTIERMIWGAREKYNDIVPTRYSHLLPLFFHPSPEKSFHYAKTKDDLEKVLASPALKSPEHLQLIEMVMDKCDTPWKLGAQLAWRGESTKQYLKREGFVDVLGNWGLQDGRGGGEAVKWA